jgi:hypothetical protein
MLSSDEEANTMRSNPQMISTGGVNYGLNNTHLNITALLNNSSMGGIAMQGGNTPGADDSFVINTNGFQGANNT